MYSDLCTLANAAPACSFSFATVGNQSTSLPIYKTLQWPIFWKESNKFCFALPAEITEMCADQKQVRTLKMYNIKSFFSLPLGFT
jgi:hypothetical protein